MFVFIKLHTTAQSVPAILVILGSFVVCVCVSACARACVYPSRLPIGPQTYPVIYTVAYPVRGHKEVRRSTVITRYSNQQGSKLEQSPCQVQPLENIMNLSASTMPLGMK